MSDDEVEAQAVPGAKLLLVEDHVLLRERLARALRARGYDVRTAANGLEAVALAREEAPELAVVDLKMPGMSGLECIRELMTIDGSVRVLVLTGYGSIATAVEAMRLGAVNYIQKPADADDVIAAFDRAGGPPLQPTDVEYQAPSLARAEWEHINRVLADCGGNISETARRLGMPRRSLQRKLAKFPPQR
jgi:two-component system response regulator RegA